MRRVLTLILSFFIISNSQADFNQFGANAHQEVWIWQPIGV